MKSLVRLKTLTDELMIARHHASELGLEDVLDPTSLVDEGGKIRVLLCRRFAGPSTASSRR